MHTRLQHVNATQQTRLALPTKPNTTLRANTPGDEYEQEAEHIANQAMAMPMHSSPDNPARVRHFSGQTDGEMMAAPASVGRTLASAGKSLDTALRQDMEQRFGYDFSQVRIHSDPAAAHSAEEVHARAYTVGHHIVFGAGQFAPGVQQGRRLLAHELTHVMQQQHQPSGIQRQPSATVLSPAAAAAAVTYMNQHYDEDSIRTLETFSNRNPDGVFDAADAEAFAQLQNRLLHVTPDGKAGEGSLNALFRVAGSTKANRSAMIHLAIDLADLDVSSVLAIEFDPSTSAPSELDTLPGGVSIIKIGDQGFVSYRVMVAEIRKQLAVKPGTSLVTPVPGTVFASPFLQRAAIFTNRLGMSDPRSIKLLQGALASKATGQWDVDLVRHIAAKQQALGMISTGLLDERTLEAIVKEMIADGSEDGVLQLIIDYYKLDRSHTLKIIFDPNPPSPTDEAETFRVGAGTGGPSVVHIFPPAFQQSFAGLVHTIAHELGHVQQVIQGVASLAVREFLSEGIEIESKGMPPESIESESDIDLMIKGQPPVHPGFIQDIHRMLRHWGHMTPAEKQANHQRYKDLRSLIVKRIVTEGTARQQNKLAPFITRLQNADSGVP